MFASSTCVLLDATHSQCQYQGWTDIIFGLALIIFLLSFALWGMITKHFFGGIDLTS
jgi:hypothetical protein